MCEVLCVTEIWEYKLDLVPMSITSNKKCNGFTNRKYLVTEAQQPSLGFFFLLNVGRH